MWGLWWLKEASLRDIGMPFFFGFCPWLLISGVDQSVFCNGIDAHLTLKGACPWMHIKSMNFQQQQLLLMQQLLLCPALISKNATLFVSSMVRLKTTQHKESYTLDALWTFWTLTQPYPTWTPTSLKDGTVLMDLHVLWWWDLFLLNYTDAHCMVEFCGLVCAIVIVVGINYLYPCTTWGFLATTGYAEPTPEPWYK